MLHSLELENFKAFGERARIPFAPITLIFGENSAGKSSILQALNLLKQTRESREAGALLLPRTENGIVDLGSFQELLFDHDLKRTLSIRMETKLDRQLAIEFSFNRPSLEE
ncbi:AAA family ATPase, partial [Candidatus Poribacteria bacterium]|nr:AAA family ATPase [Candidatus Poribacteria bacterium]